MPPGSDEALPGSGALLPPFPPRAIVFAESGVEADAVIERLGALDPATDGSIGSVRRFRTRGGHTWDVLVAQPSAAADAAAAFRPQVALLAGVSTALGEARPGDVVLASQVRSWDQAEDMVFSWEADFSAFTKAEPLSSRLFEDQGEGGPPRTLWLAPVIAGPGMGVPDGAARGEVLRSSGARTLAVEPADSELVDTLRACGGVPTLVVRGIGDQATAPPGIVAARSAAAAAINQLGLCVQLWADHARLFLDAARDGLAEHSDSIIPVLEEAASTSIARQDFPGTWVMIKKVLGDAWRGRAERGPATDLERAVAAYESALDVLDPSSDPELWARTKCGLGQALAARRGDNRAESIEDALGLFADALEVQKRPDLTEDWARTQHARGLAFRRRLVGDPAANLAQAISAFRSAVGVFTEDEHFSEWSRASINLASALREGLTGPASEDRQEAMELMLKVSRAALDQNRPEEFAAAVYTLGLLLAEGAGDDAGTLEAACTAYDHALTVWTRSRFPRDWALAQNALGNAYRDLAQLKDAEGNLNRARKTYERALSVYTLDSDPQRWAAVSLNIGNVYRDLAKGSRGDDFDRAVQAYRAVCQVYRVNTDPSEARRVRTNLGRLLLGHDADQAYAVLGEAIEADRASYSRAQTEASRSADIAQSERLYAAMVDCCLQIKGREGDAFQFADASRSRILRQQLGTRELPAPEHVPASLLDEEAALIRRLGSLSGPDADALSSRPEGEWLDAVHDLGEARVALERLWEIMVHDYAANDYVALRRGDGLDWDDLVEWLAAQAREVAILEFFSLESSTIAFVVRKGQDRPISLVVPLGEDGLRECVTDFYYEVHRSTPDSLRTETWKRSAAPLLATVVPELTGVDLLYIIPHGQLHYLPLHAVEQDGKPLIEYTAVAYAPSAALAVRLAQLSEPQHGAPVVPTAGGRALVVGDPEGDRPFAAREAEAIGGMLGVSPLVGPAAKKAEVASRIAAAELAHIAGHAFFDHDDPLASGIVLAEGDPEGVLSARELISARLNTRLLVLSGCETGLQEVRPGDELVGLSRALFYAGVQSLVLSMWEVDDPVTSALMISFYGQLLSTRGGETTLADAIRSAMLKVRPEHSHTYLWAPFALSGRWR